MINLDEYSDIRTHWIALYAFNNIVTYFYSFGVKHIPKETKRFIDNKNVITNIFIIQAYDSIMCGYLCIRFTDFMLKDKSLTDFIWFIDFMVKDKSLTDFNNLFSPNDFKK